MVMAVPRRVSIEYVADVVCPWCFIGWHRMQQAVSLAEQNNIAVHLQWTPFILRPHLPKSGLDKLDVFAQMGMGREGARDKMAHIRSTASEIDGLCLDFEGQVTAA